MKKYWINWQDENGVTGFVDKHYYCLSDGKFSFLSLCKFFKTRKEAERVLQRVENRHTDWMFIICDR